MSNGIGDLDSDDKGSAARFNSGKPRLSLIPLSSLEEEARVWEYGLRKYTEWNWLKGMPWSYVMDSLLRHLSAYQSGEDMDTESGLPHTAHILCNARMLDVFRITYPDGDDRPPKELLHVPK